MIEALLMREVTAEKVGARALKPLIAPDLVGREEELAALVEAATHPPSLIVIEGEAGVGKTRLVEELLRRPELQACRRLVGRCQPLREQFRFAPIVQAIRRIDALEHGRRLTPAAGVLRSLVPELGVLPPPARDLSGSHVVERHLFFRAILDLLGAVGKAVVIIEDAHWADGETVDLLSFLAGQLPPNLALVVTYRREQLPAGSPLISLTSRVPGGAHGGKLELQPLAADSVGTLVARILGAGAVSQDFAEFMHQRTDGLPFAIEEVLRLMLDRSDVVFHDGRWLRRAISQLGMPPAIRDAVAQRVGELPRYAQCLVEAAAVLDRASPPELLAAVGGVPSGELIAALCDALRSGLLVEDDGGATGFRHALARDAVYAALATALRQRLHRRAAREYERRRATPRATLAHHLKNAGDPRWLQVADAAADEASENSHDFAAVTLFAELLGSTDLPPGGRPRIARKLGWAAYRGVVHDVRVCELLTTAVEDEALTAQQRGELRFLLGFLRRLTGDASAAHLQWKLAVEELGSDPLAARVMTHLADPWVFEATLDDHIAWLERAVAAAAAASPDVRQAIDITRATILQYVGDRDGATAVRRLILDGATGEARRLLLWAHVDFSAAAFNLGRYHEAAEHVASVREHADGAEAESLRDALQTTEVMLDWGTGRWEDLEERATRHAEQTHDVPRWSLAGVTVAASLALARGNLTAVERLTRQCLAEARAGGVLPAYALACALRARVHLDQGREDDACEQVLEGLRPLAQKGIWVWSHYVLPTAVDALLTRGRVDEVAALLDEAAHGLADRDAPAARAALALCRGQLAEGGGDLATAAVEYECAATRFAELPHRWFVAVSRARRAAVQLIAGDSSGREPLNESLAALAALGATADVNRVRRTLKRHSITVGPQWRGGRAGYGSKLSPRELQIAHLVAEGFTNPAVGQRLYLSPRTVEHHLSSVMRKFGVTSRVTLANRLRELGGELQ